ncbi:MAG: hypothetical protein PHO35_03885 [Candidatus Cloacimonetes bacterium]|jgi:hypothetical protein|nr:hypothetical protein [Candidatus Cloacimonadota bacterium]MDD4805914.1 hypothetical protein [Candidatus Cloacimonadota bacterium]
MLFLKSLLFIVWNIAWGLSLVYLLKWFLFNPKARYFFGKRVFLTPGFIVRKREWLFVKARDLLHDYLRQAENPRMEDGYLKAWEEKVHDFLWDKTSFVDGWPFLPHKLKHTIRMKIVDAFASMVSGLLRKTVPRLLEQWRVEHRIDDYDFQFSIDFFLKYYNRYFHKYLMYFFIGLNLIIGISNMILFILIGILS